MWTNIYAQVVVIQYDHGTAWLLRPRSHQKAEGATREEKPKRTIEATFSVIPHTRLSHTRAIATLYNIYAIDTNTTTRASSNLVTWCEGALTLRIPITHMLRASRDREADRKQAEKSHQ